jgi:hypothetical protein
MNLWEKGVEVEKHALIDDIYLICMLKIFFDMNTAMAYIYNFVLRPRKNRTGPVSVRPAVVVVHLRRQV